MLTSLTLSAILALVQHTQQHPDVKLHIADSGKLYSLFRGNLEEELWETHDPWVMVRPVLGVPEPLAVNLPVPKTGPPAIRPVAFLLPPATTVGQHALKVCVS